MLCGAIHFFIIIIIRHSFSFISLPFWPWPKRYAICHLMTLLESARNSHDCVYQKVPPPSGDVVDHSMQRIWELHLQRSDPVEGKRRVFLRAYSLYVLLVLGLLIGGYQNGETKLWKQPVSHNEMWYMITCLWGRVLASWATILPTW